MDNDISLYTLSQYYNHYYKGFRIAIKERHKCSCGRIHLILSNMADMKVAMTKKLKEQVKKEYVKPKFIGYVNVEIPAEKKAEVKQWIREDELVALEIDEMAAGLYRISFGVMQGKNSYQASATCNDPDSPNAGLVLSAQANNWYDALAVLCWKHRVLLRGDWSKNLPEDPDSDIA